MAVVMNQNRSNLSLQRLRLCLILFLSSTFVVLITTSLQPTTAIIQLNGPLSTAKAIIAALNNKQAKIRIRRSPNPDSEIDVLIKLLQALRPLTAERGWGKGQPTGGYIYKPPSTSRPEPDEVEQEILPGGFTPPPATYLPPTTTTTTPSTTTPEDEEDIQPGGFTPSTTTTTTTTPSTTTPEDEEDIQPGGFTPSTTTTEAPASYGPPEIVTPPPTSGYGYPESPSHDGYGVPSQPTFKPLGLRDLYRRQQQQDYDDDYYDEGNVGAGQSQFTQSQAQFQPNYDDYQQQRPGVDLLKSPNWYSNSYSSSRSNSYSNPYSNYFNSNPYLYNFW